MLGERGERGERPVGDGDDRGADRSERLGCLDRQAAVAEEVEHHGDVVGAGVGEIAGDVVLADQAHAGPDHREPALQGVAAGAGRLAGRDPDALGLDDQLRESLEAPLVHRFEHRIDARRDLVPLAPGLLAANAVARPG